MSNPSSSYRLVPKRAEESRDNEIRVKAYTRPFVYAAYAGKLLLEKKHDHVYMIATGAATSRAIQSVEYVRRRVGGLMVCYEIESTEFLDDYEPLVEGLERVQVRRMVPTLKAHLFLSKNAELEEKPGFMAALPAEDMLDEDRFKQEIAEHFSKDRPERYNGERGGQRGRGGYGRDRPRGEYRGPRGQDDGAQGDRGQRRSEYRGGAQDGEQRRSEYRGGAQDGGQRRSEYRGGAQDGGQRRSEYRGGAQEGGQRRSEYRGGAQDGGQRTQEGRQVRNEGRGRGYGNDANRVDERPRTEETQQQSLRKQYEGEQHEQQRRTRHNYNEYADRNRSEHDTRTHGYHNQGRGGVPHGEQRRPNYFRGQ